MRWNSPLAGSCAACRADGASRRIVVQDTEEYINVTSDWIAGLGDLTLLELLSPANSGNWVKMPTLNT